MYWNIIMLTGIVLEFHLDHLACPVTFYNYSCLYKLLIMDFVCQDCDNWSEETTGARKPDNWTPEDEDCLPAATLHKLRGDYTTLSDEAATQEGGNKNGDGYPSHAQRALGLMGDMLNVLHMSTQQLNRVNYRVCTL
jgi:hypothetical protein